jgi:hypothetical protein
MAHTPGPLEVDAANLPCIVVVGADRKDIAEFFFREEHTVSATRDQALANARLFIAAPRLLRIAEMLLQGIENRSLPNFATIDLSVEPTGSFPLRPLSDILREVVDQATAL